MLSRRPRGALTKMPITLRGKKPRGTQRQPSSQQPPISRSDNLNGNFYWRRRFSRFLQGHFASTGKVGLSGRPELRAGPTGNSDAVSQARKGQKPLSFEVPLQPRGTATTTTKMMVVRTMKQTQACWANDDVSAAPNLILSLWTPPPPTLSPFPFQILRPSPINHDKPGRSSPPEMPRKVAHCRGRRRGDTRVPFFRKTKRFLTEKYWLPTFFKEGGHKSHS